jgi:DNA-binding NarL/FixJ family response regulator
MQNIKILIVDDDAGFRRRIQKLLATESGIEVIGEAVDGQEAVLKAKKHKPDLVLIDIRMPKMSGIEATHQLKSEMPTLKVIILTIFFEEQEYREVVMDKGANGYIIKKSLLDELIPTIRNIF